MQRMRWCIRVDADLDRFARREASKNRMSLAAWIRSLLLKEMAK